MRKTIRKTKIVGTIGPSSQSYEMLKRLMEVGLNVARINFSHGSFEDNKVKIETIKAVREELRRPLALLLDTKGPEIRTGVLETGDEKVLIEEGQTFTFITEDLLGNKEHTSISYKDLYKDVTVGSKLLLDDGALEFQIMEVKGTDIICKALNRGMLGSRKTMNVPGVKLELPALTQKDVDDITKGVQADFDYIAASFVRKVSDIEEIRNLLNSVGGEKVKIIAKIENQEGIDNFDEILKVSDGIMVARGDMGVEIPMEDVPIVQKHFIKKCNEVGKPVIIATQMLESMITNPRPTRAEVSDVANAVYDEAGAIMLSGECAMGKYPVECVKAMNKISRSIEKSIKYWKRFDAKNYEDIDSEDFEGNIALTACITAKHLKADAIVAYTHSGNSIRRLSGMGPECPIYAIADDEKTYNQLSVVGNVRPVLVTNKDSIEDRISEGIKILKQQEILEKGDLVVLSGGSKILPKEGDNKVIGGFAKIN